jgi:hypothetical protein
MMQSRSVIDATRGTIFLVAKTKENGTFVSASPDLQCSARRTQINVTLADADYYLLPRILPSTTRRLFLPPTNLSSISPVPSSSAFQSPALDSDSVA